jgi:hypothetical protein
MPQTGVAVGVMVGVLVGVLVGVNVVVLVEVRVLVGVLVRAKTPEEGRIRNAKPKKTVKIVFLNPAGLKFNFRLKCVCRRRTLHPTPRKNGAIELFGPRQGTDKTREN